MARDDGFSKMPNVVLDDDRLKPHEQVLFTKLYRQVWLHRQNRSSHDVIGKPTPLPAAPDLAERIGVSESTLIRQLNALRRHGYVVTERPSRRSPLIYTLFANAPSPVTDAPSPVTDDMTQSCHGRQDSDDPSIGPSEEGNHVDENQTPTPPAIVGDAGASLATTSDDDSLAIPWDEVGDPPTLVADDQGQTLAFNALAKVCGIRKGSPRLKLEVPVALNGDRRRLDTQPGINRLFWHQVAAMSGQPLAIVRARATANPLGYQRMLVQAIEHMAVRYRERMNGATITPTALAKWWLDLAPHDDDDTVDTGRGMTPDEIRSFRG